MQFLAGDVKTKLKASRQTKNPKKHHLALCVSADRGGGEWSWVLKLLCMCDSGARIISAQESNIDSP
jgi:hypothetical protein